MQSWGHRAGSRREGLYLEHRPLGIGTTWFSSCRWVFHFHRGHHSLEGWQAWPHSTILCKRHFPWPEPWLAPGGAVPRSLPPPTPQLCVPLSFSSPFLPFLPQGHKRKFLLPTECWQGPLSPAVRGHPASMPSWPGRWWQLLSV